MALAELPSLVRTVQLLFLTYLDSVERKFERFAGYMVNWVIPFSKLNPVLVSIAIYVLCTGAGFILCIAMGFLDLAAGTHVLEALLLVMEGLNDHVLPTLQLLNGLLALLVVFSIPLGRNNIIIYLNSNRFRSDPNTVSSILSRRSKMIRSLPTAKYGCLRKPDDSSSCSICLGCIEEDDGVRILPNCRHYFHTSCIDRWLLPCTVNNSSCPLCRATVIGFHSSQSQ